MVTINVEIEDWDEGSTYNVELPCDIDRVVDQSHELLLSDWDTTLPIDNSADIGDLNDILFAINGETPDMDLDLFEKIVEASGKSDFLSEENAVKYCTADYFLEIVTENKEDLSDDEKAAKYLATTLMIPFAKTVTQSTLTSFRKTSNDRVNWENVWKHYEVMGFKHFNHRDCLYVFNFQDKEDDND